MLLLCRVSSNPSAIQRSDRACTWDIAPCRWPSLWMHFPPCLSQSFWDYQMFWKMCWWVPNKFSLCWSSRAFCSWCILGQLWQPVIPGPLRERCDLWEVGAYPQNLHFLEAFWGHDLGICLQEPAPCNCSCYSENKVQNTAAIQQRKEEGQIVGKY